MTQRSTLSVIPKDEELRMRWNQRRAEIEIKLAEQIGGRLLVDSYTYIVMSAVFNFHNCKKGISSLRSIGVGPSNTLKKGFHPL